MAVMSLVFALFTVGYILGVWTSCVVFRQPQRVYEEGAPWLATERRVRVREVVVAGASSVELRTP
jgi:hypothetical protein